MEIPQWNTETQANNNTWLTKGPVSYCISLSTQTGKETPENINVTGWFHMQPLKITSLQTLGSFQFSSFAQLCRPHGLQHTWLPCSSPTPRVYSNPCPLSRWCHSTISSSVVPFSYLFQSFLASGPFPVYQFFTSGGQRIRASALASVLPMNIQDWFPLGWTSLILHPRDFQESSSTPQFKSINCWCSAFFTVQLSQPYMTTGKTIALTRRTLVGKVMSLLLNMLSRLVIIFFQGASVF